MHPNPISQHVKNLIRPQMTPTDVQSFSSGWCYLESQMNVNILENWQSYQYNCM